MARAVMVLQTQMVCVQRDDAVAHILPVVVESGHSRFLVLDEDRDDIAGILLAKDLLRLCAQEERERFDIREYMRPAVFVPESKRRDLLAPGRSRPAERRWSRRWLYETVGLFNGYRVQVRPPKARPA